MGLLPFWRSHGRPTRLQTILFALLNYTEINRSIALGGSHPKAPLTPKAEGNFAETAGRSGGAWAPSPSLRILKSRSKVGAILTVTCELPTKSASCVSEERLVTNHSLLERKEGREGDREGGQGGEGQGGQVKVQAIPGHHPGTQEAPSAAPDLALTCW